MQKLTILILLLISKVGYCHNISNESENNSNTIMAAKVFNITTKKTALTINENYFMTPASLEKLITSYATIKNLSNEYRFATTLSYDGRIEKNMINGNILLKFNGDPTLLSSDLTNLIGALKQHNITKITGDLIIDDTTFDNEFYAPGWMWDEVDDCYATITNSAIIDRNCVTATIKSNTNSINISLSEKLIPTIKTDIKINNEQCALKFHPNFKYNYYLTGCMRPNTTEKLDIATRNPYPRLENKIKKILKQQNIRLSGNIIFVSLPNKKLQQITTHYSKPIKEIIKIMLKKSDNLIAESLFKTIGKIKRGSPGTWQQGQAIATNDMQEIATMPIYKGQFVDGSGLSRYNYISAQQLTILLAEIASKRYYSTTIEKALPIAGIDGTLEWLTDNVLSNNLHAKTGSMSGILNIAGYFSYNNNDYTIVVMLQNPNLKKKQLQELMSSVLTEIVASI